MSETGDGPVERQQEGVGPAEETAPPPPGEPTDRRKRLWIGLGGIAVVGAVVAALLLVLGGGGDGVTGEEWSRIDLGMAKAEVEQIIGERGEPGSHTFMQAGTEVVEPDCWFYTPLDDEGNEAEGEAIVCFDAAGVSAISTPGVLFVGGDAPEPADG